MAEDMHWCGAGHEVLCEQYDISVACTEATTEQSVKTAVIQQPAPAGVHVDTQTGQHVTVTAAGVPLYH